MGQGSSKKSLKLAKLKQKVWNKKSAKYWSVVQR
jgi:hypothetical protein